MLFALGVIVAALLFFWWLGRDGFVGDCPEEVADLMDDDHHWFYESEETPSAV